MINVTPILPGTATTQDYMVEIVEPLCDSVCVGCVSVMSGNVSFAYSAPTVVNGVAVVPVTASGSIVINGPSGSCRAKVRHFAEAFQIPMTATTDNTITLTPGANNNVVFANGCSKSSKVKMTTTLQIAIA